MRVFIAPDLPNNGLPHDYCCTTPGELVFPWSCFCSDPLCNEMFSGEDTHKASKWAQIAERPDLGEAEWRERFLADLESRGWVTRPFEEEAEELAETALDDFQCVENFPVGSIIGATDTGFYLREVVIPDEAS